MARFGRKVVMKNNLSQVDHEKYTKQLADEYPRVIEKIDGFIKEIVTVIQEHDPLELMLRAYWDMFYACFLKQTDEPGIAFDDNTAQRTLEYIQSVIVSIPSKADAIGKPISEEDWAKLTDLISDMYICLISEYQIHRTAYRKLNDLDYDSELDEFQVKAMMYWCTVRGNRHPFHDIPHLKALLEPHEEVFQELFSINVKTFLEEVGKIQISLFRGVGEAFEELNSYISKAFEDGSYELSAANEEDREKLEALAHKALRFDCFDIKKVANLPEILLSELSLEPNAENEFFAPGEFSGWPLRVMPIHKKPFLKVGENYYCFEYTSFSDHLYRSLQRIIVRLKPDYAPNSAVHPNWKDQQTQITEQLPFEMLQSILPGAEIYRPIHYQYPQTPSNSKNWNECDGILIYDDALFIVEIKAGAFTHSSPAVDFQAYIESVKKLLFSPWKQSKRFYEYLESSDEVPIYSAENKQDKPLRILKRSDFRQIIPCAITLDNLTQLASRLETLEPLGTDTSQLPIWAVSIDDLRIYTDLFKSPLKVLHYLEERQKAYKNPHFIVDDELFHLGMYFQHNQYSSLAQELGGSASPLFTGYSEDIDRYYNQLYIEPEVAKLPQQELPENLETILNVLELQRKPGRSKVSSYLLAFGNKGREQVASAIGFILQKQLERGSYIKFSCVGQAKITLSCRVVEFMPKKDIIRDYALAEVLGNQENERLLLDLGYDRSMQLVDVSWEFLTKTDICPDDIERLKELHKLEEAKREKTFLNKKIGRNEHCPCGSGKKYKRCHGAT